MLPVFDKVYYVFVVSYKEEKRVGSLYLGMLAKAIFCHVPLSGAEICKRKIGTAVAAKIPFPPIYHTFAYNAVSHDAYLYNVYVKCVESYSCMAVGWL